MELILKTHRVKQQVMKRRDIHQWNFKSRSFENAHQNTQETVLKTNFDAIQTWIKNKQHIFDFEVLSIAPEYNAMLDINDDDFDSITQDLYRHGIVFDY